VQPIIAKQILPWFGGSAAVWATCLVFFQSVLLAGYAYADWTTRLGPRRQALAHVVLLAGSLAFLPILASSGWKPQGNEQPITRILLLLAATIGLPYFLLSTTTPLSRPGTGAGSRAPCPTACSRSPTRIAACAPRLSLLLEPAFDLGQLGWSWSLLYAGFVVLCAALGLTSAGKAAPPPAEATSASPPSPTVQLLCSPWQEWAR